MERRAESAAVGGRRVTAGRVFLSLLLAVSVVAAGDRSRPRIEQLEVEREDDQVRVSFRLADGLSDELLERIHSGVPVTFRHKVELLLRRSVPLWFSKVVAQTRVDASVRYDSLTRQYELLRRVSTRDSKAKSEPLETMRRTESVEEMRSWLTRLTELPSLALPPAAKGSRLRVRVESNLGRHYVLYLFPARHTVSAERKLGS